MMNQNTIGVWRLSRALPFRKRLWMRAGLALYVVGLRRLGVQVAGEVAAVRKGV